MKHPPRKHINLRLDDDVRAALIEQAEAADRSLNGQIQWLIKQEAKRREEAGR